MVAKTGGIFFKQVAAAVPPGEVAILMQCF